jgi:hypothetical protein
VGRNQGVVWGKGGGGQEYFYWQESVKEGVVERSGFVNVHCAYTEGLEGGVCHWHGLHMLDPAQPANWLYVQHLRLLAQVARLPCHCR